MKQTPLTKAAQELITAIKSPSEFAYFLGDAVIWVSEYQNHKLGHKKMDYDPSMVLGFYIQDVIPAWIAGDKNLVGDVAESLKIFVSMDEYKKDVSEILFAFSHAMQMGDMDSSNFEKRMHCVNTLLNLGDYFSAYEKIQEKERKKAIAA